MKTLLTRYGNAMTIQRIIVVINLMLLLLGGYICAGTLYQFSGLYAAPVHLDTTAPNDKAAQVQTGNLPLAHYNPILERDLFKTQKEPETIKPPEKKDYDNLEETKLNLKLWGTVSGEEKERAYAVIEDTQSRQQNLYRIGDTIQNATVKDILRERVVISVNGKDEFLSMEKLEQVGGIRPVAAKAPFSRPAAFSKLPARTQRISLRRGMINDAMNDVSKLMTQIAIKPHIEDGQPAGLAMTNIKPNSIFRRMGLRNGDILKGVDGQQIRSVDDALKLYDSLKSAENVNVQIQRRGRDRNINYHIR